MSQMKWTSKFTAFAVGVGAGALLAMLFAPASGEETREYLTGRGINDEVMKQFRIGYAPDSGFALRDWRGSNTIAWRRFAASTMPLPAANSSGVCLHPWIQITTG